MGDDDTEIAPDRPVVSGDEPTIAPDLVGDLPTMAAQPERAETVGRYRVSRQLGAGGMGSVFAAYDPELDRRVAIKVLLPQDERENSKARLRAEARALAKLQHPNIVPVFDVGEHEGQLFVVMELVDGETLSSWAQRTQPTQRQTCRTMAQVARGLAAAHTAGIIHRDIKPGNVMIDGEGMVRVLDFGIARPEARVEEVTATGALVGTPAYMAPEQIEGEPQIATDAFALGIVLHELLAGERPFRATTAEALLVQIMTSKPASLPEDIPSSIRELVGDLLEKDPKVRLSDMSRIADRLEAQSRGEDTSPPAKPGRSWNTLAMGLAVGGVLAVIGFGVRYHWFESTGAAPQPGLTTPDPAPPKRDGPEIRGLPGLYQPAPALPANGRWKAWIDPTGVHWQPLPKGRPTQIASGGPDEWELVSPAAADAVILVDHERQLWRWRIDEQRLETQGVEIPDGRLRLSPNGERLLVTQVDDSSTVMIVDLNGRVRRVPGTFESSPIDLGAAWEPDGQAFVLAVSQGRSTHLVRVTIDDLQPTKLGTVDGQWVRSMAWDDDALVACASGKDHFRSLLRIPVTTGSLGPAEPYAELEQECWEVWATDDGVAVTQELGRRIELVSLGTPKPDRTPLTADAWPLTWSNKMLVVAVPDEESGTRVDLVGADDRATLGTLALGEEAPLWAPALGIVVRHPTHLDVLPLDGEPTRIEGNFQPVFPPPKSQRTLAGPQGLLSIDYRDPPRLSVSELDLEARTFSRVGDIETPYDDQTHRLLDWMPAMSGDGSTIAFSHPSGSLFVVDTETLEGKTLNTDSDTIETPQSVAWLPSGDALVVTGMNTMGGAVYRIARVDLDGEAQLLLSSDFSWSSRPLVNDAGTQLAIRTTDLRQQVLVLAQ